MKRIVFYLLTALTLSVAPTAQAAKGATPIEVPNDHKKAAARANVLLARLDEIKAMDKSSMTRAERKELRKEVKEIRSELRTTNNGVYLSVGAIIIIILLLILLL